MRPAGPPTSWSSTATPSGWCRTGPDTTRWCGRSSTAKGWEDVEEVRRAACRGCRRAAPRGSGVRADDADAVGRRREDRVRSRGFALRNRVRRRGGHDDRHQERRGCFDRLSHHRRGRGVLGRDPPPGIRHLRRGARRRVERTRDGPGPRRALRPDGAGPAVRSRRGPRHRRSRAAGFARRGRAAQGRQDRRTPPRDDGRRRRVPRAVHDRDARHVPSEGLLLGVGPARRRREDRRRRHAAPPPLVGLDGWVREAARGPARRPPLPARRDEGRPVRLPNRRRGRRVPQGAGDGAFVLGERGHVAQARRPEDAARRARLARVPLRGRSDAAGPVHGRGRRHHERAPRFDGRRRGDARRHLPRVQQARGLQPAPPVLPELLRRRAGAPRLDRGPDVRRRATAAFGSRTGTPSGSTRSPTTAFAS